MEKAYRIKDRLQLHSRILHCKREQLWLFLECIACTGLLFSVCFNNNVWPDEAFSFDMAAHYSVMDIIIRTAGDVHPPFYYLLAHMFVILFGKKLIVLKAVSVLAAAGCMLLSATVVYRRFGLKTAAAMIFLSAFAPQMAFFGVQLRMYSWAAFFVFGTGVYAYEIVRDGSRKNWMLFVLFTVGGAYTLYFACLSMSLVWLYLFIRIIRDERKQLRNFMTAFLTAAGLYLPWIYMYLTYSVQGTAERAETVKRLSVSDLKEFLLWVFASDEMGGTAVYLLLAVFAVLLLFFMKKGQEEKKFCAVLFCCPLWTFLIGKICTAEASRALQDRYMAPSLLLFWFGFVLVWTNMRNRVYYVWMLVLCMLGIGNYHYVYDDEYYVAPYIHQTEAFIASQMKPGDVVVYDVPGYELMYSYYMPSQTILYAKDINLAEYRGKTLWYLKAWGGFPDQQKAEQLGITITDCGKYGVQSMNFEIEKVTVP